MKHAPIGKEHRALWLEPENCLAVESGGNHCRADALASVNREKLSDTQSNRHAVARH